MVMRLNAGVGLAGPPVQWTGWSPVPTQECCLQWQTCELWLPRSTPGINHILSEFAGKMLSETLVPRPTLDRATLRKPGLHSGNH